MNQKDIKIIIETKEQLKKYITTNCTSFGDIRTIAKEYRYNREYLEI